jgi:hypothetical protein
MIEALKNFFRVGGLLARIIDFIDDLMIKVQAAKDRKVVQDALIARANDVRAGELPDDPRDYRD